MATIMPPDMRWAMLGAGLGNGVGQYIDERNQKNDISAMMDWAQKYKQYKQMEDEFQRAKYAQDQTAMANRSNFVNNITDPAGFAIANIASPNMALPAMPVAPTAPTFPQLRSSMGQQMVMTGMAKNMFDSLFAEMMPSGVDRARTDYWNYKAQEVGQSLPYKVDLARNNAGLAGERINTEVARQGTLQAQAGNYNAQAGKNVAEGQAATSRAKSYGERVANQNTNETNRSNAYVRINDARAQLTAEQQALAQAKTQTEKDLRQGRIDKIQAEIDYLNARTQRTQQIIKTNPYINKTVTELATMAKAIGLPIKPMLDADGKPLVDATSGKEIPDISQFIPTGPVEVKEAQDIIVDPNANPAWRKYNQMRLDAYNQVIGGNTQAAPLAQQSNQQYQMGQIIPKGGANWKVIGFYPDGEPNVVQVK